jgi:Flp pilus assembly protein TadB
LQQEYCYACDIEPLLKGADIMSLERAILLFVGATVLVTVLLGVYHSLNWLWITGLLGAHLVQASFTGFCPVVRALKSMGYQSKPSFT